MDNVNKDTEINGEQPKVYEDGGSSSSIDWKRQKEIFNPEEKGGEEEISIVGIGNIGSQTGLALARLGVNLFNLYDDDIVEAHNLSSQSFFIDDLEKTKVIAMRDQIHSINDKASVITKETHFTGKQFGEGVLIIAVDSMEARREIFEEMIKEGKTPSLIIDGRMGGPQIEIYTFTDINDWEKKLYAESSPDPCGARYICYISMIMGALIANQVKRHLNGEDLKKSIVFHMDSLQLI